jgi:hypothetical protein
MQRGLVLAWAGGGQRRDIVATVIEAVVLSKADGPKNRFDPDRVTVIWRP